MHVASTTETHIVCLLHLRAVASKVSEPVTVVTSAFLLGVAILVFGASSLTFLAWCATSLVGSAPAVFRKVTFLRARMTDSISLEHTQKHRRWACLAAVCITAAINVHLSQGRGFKKKCSRKEAPDGWSSTTPSLIASQMMSPLCCSKSRTCFSPFCSQLRHYPTSNFHSFVHWTVVHHVERFSIRRQTQDAARVRVVCFIIRSHRVRFDLQFLLTC